MDQKELQRICEAILFASGDPVETDRLAFAAECAPEEVQEASSGLNAYLIRMLYGK